MEQTFSLVDEISTTEYDMMETYRENYGCGGEYISTTRVPVKSVLAEWEAKKQKLYQVLGKKLIVSKQVQYNKDIDEIVDEMNEVLSSNCLIGRVNRNGFAFKDAFNKWIRENFQTPYQDYNSDLGIWDWPVGTSEEDAKEYDKRVAAREGLYNMINIFTLAENVYKGGSFSITLANGKEYKVNNGVKPLRVLGKIAESFGIPEFEDFRICHSYALNQRAIGGEISLSIHPLDFWTMSDNSCGWDSCMSWEEYGGYRRGTVEMMNSPFVVVAYLNSTTNSFTIAGQPWSNKKWRQLFIVDKDFIVGIKEYPYHNAEISNYVLNWLKELAEENMGWKYLDQSAEYKTNGPLTNPYFEGDEFRIWFETNAMYNDFGSGNHKIYIGNHLCSEYLKEHGVSTNYNGRYRFNFSGNSQCMCCGKIDSNFDFEGSLYCWCCEKNNRCEECGEQADTLYELDGTMLCECCYDSVSLSCISCGTDHYRDNTEQIVIVPRLTEKMMKTHCYGIWQDKKEDEIILPEYYECDTVNVCQNSPACVKKFETDYLKEGAEVKTCYHYHYKYPVYYVYYDELKTPECGDFVRWNRWNSLSDNISQEDFVSRHFNRSDFTRFKVSSTKE